MYFEVEIPLMMGIVYMNDNPAAISVYNLICDDDDDDDDMIHDI